MSRKLRWQLSRQPLQPLWRYRASGAPTRCRAPVVVFAAVGRSPGMLRGRIFRYGVDKGLGLGSVLAFMYSRFNRAASPAHMFYRGIGRGSLENSRQRISSSFAIYRLRGDQRLNCHSAPSAARHQCFSGNHITRTNPSSILNSGSPVAT